MRVVVVAAVLLTAVTTTAQAQDAAAGEKIKNDQPFPAITGSPAARHSGRPSSSRRTV